ncbi:hypothetical protein N7541_006375 [Penicillium brevicompactum]|uniref:Protein kinase domain-containing protein n=1 Tax=Penicillium brevicompactum TaxID=5074 RepID=A0A9W9R5A7_PENBR|nr:hypothetical protein N7541_006375 [Penicillium brevicompactum]
MDRLHFLEGVGGIVNSNLLTSEASLAFYEHLGVENPVQSVIAELCKIPAARQEFHLGDGIAFKDHGNALDPVKGEESVITGPCRPDQYCIHRVNEGTGTLLTTVEYKPPHKLSVASLRIGLREMDFWDEVVRPNFVPTEETEKLRYNATRLTGSALAQEYHIMIQEGLEYSYLTVGLALVLLRVRADDPETLYYQLCEPATDIEVNGDRSFEQPMSAIARVLCLCLMSFKSQVRDQKWRQDVGPRLQTWETSFSHERSRIPGEELQKDPPDSPFNSSFSDSSVSEYTPTRPTSPVETPTDENRMRTRSGGRCAPSNPTRHDSPGPDPDASSGGQQHGSSHNGSSSSSPFTQKTTSQTNTSGPQSSATQRANAPFCTQRCLLGLQKGGLLDDHCPNVSLHRQGGESSHHPISAEELVKQIRQQLEDDIDDCTPMGECGSYGAPFKITSALWGYTIVGKGTTTRLWGEVSREADVYRILARLQGSAVTVFLGPIDLAKMYFLHGAGPIKHMLLMGWGGEPIKEVDPLRREYSRSINEILALGVVHQDLRPANLLWNTELGRVLVIDFHRCQLDPRPDRKRKREKKYSRGRRRTREGEQPGVVS